MNLYLNSFLNSYLNRFLRQVFIIVRLYIVMTMLTFAKSSEQYKIVCSEYASVYKYTLLTLLGINNTNTLYDNGPN